MGDRQSMLEQSSARYIATRKRPKRLLFPSLVYFMVAPRPVSPFTLGGRYTSRNQRRSTDLINPSKYVSSERVLKAVRQHGGTAVELPPVVSKQFELDLPEGRCLGLSLTEPTSHLLNALHNQETAMNEPTKHHWIHDCLHKDEIQFVRSMQGAASNQISFVVGRLAMRSIIGVSATDYAILKDAYGRPELPNGYLGSISHKKSTAVALVAQQETDIINMGVGVDLEYATERKAGVAPKVLTTEELQSLGRVKGVSAAEEVLLRFSMKESLYKAMHPLLCQYVGFQEVEVQPLSCGKGQVDFDFAGSDQLVDITCHWRRVGGFFLSSASMRLIKGPQNSPADRSETKARGSCELQ